MSVNRITQYGLFAGIVLSLCACSYVPFSSGELQGTSSAALDDWRQIADVDIVQLETNPDDPYSVNLWMIAEQNHLYVYAGDSHGQWAQNIDKNANVRMLVKPNLYELAASRVTSEDEFQSFAEAWLAKYSSNRRDSTAAGTYLYRLTARD